VRAGRAAGRRAGHAPGERARGGFDVPVSRRLAVIAGALWYAVTGRGDGGSSSSGDASGDV